MLRQWWSLRILFKIYKRIIVMAKKAGRFHMSIADAEKTKNEQYFVQINRNEIKAKSSWLSVSRIFTARGGLADAAKIYTRCGDVRLRNGNTKIWFCFNDYKRYSRVNFVSIVCSSGLQAVCMDVCVSSLPVIH